MHETWLRYNDLNAEFFDEHYDLIVVHDPQPVGLISAIERLGKRPLGKHWIWHSHLDLSEAQPDVWDMLRPSAERYDAVVFDMAEYARADIRAPLVAVIHPAIDPLHPKNMIKVSDETVRTVLGRFDVDPDRPLISQVSPFDQRHDPLGLIDVYRQVRMEVPGLQLVLVALMTTTDPQARTYFELATERAGDEKDIHVLSSLNDLGNLEVNVLQRAAQVVVQRYSGKGFAIMASEAMWKERPVVAARVSGIPAQIVDGRTGYVVDDDKGFVERIVHLLKNPGMADEMGRRAKEHVRHNFLVTRQIKDYLTLFNGLMTGGA
jgi:trehalose synthase